MSVKICENTHVPLEMCTLHIPPLHVFLARSFVCCLIRKSFKLCSTARCTFMSCVLVCWCMECVCWLACANNKIKYNFGLLKILFFRAIGLERAQFIRGRRKRFSMEVHRVLGQRKISCFHGVFDLKPEKWLAIKVN